MDLQFITTSLGIFISADSAVGCNPYDFWFVRLQFGHGRYDLYLRFIIISVFNTVLCSLSLFGF